MSKVTLTFCAGKERQLTWVRKDEDYCANFFLPSRMLSDFEYNVFRFHFLLGADWETLLQKMNIDRGTFFHCVYRVEQKLGRTFREVQPYSLYPLDEYFGGRLRKSRVSSPADHIMELPMTFEVEPVLEKTTQKLAAFGSPAVAVVMALDISRSARAAISSHPLNRPNAVSHRIST